MLFTSQELVPKLLSMFETITFNFSGKVRRAVVNGKSYLVAPMTLIVPGVLNGSKGRLYYPPEEVSKNPAIWNGVPLTLGHPTHPTTNEHQSANDEGVLDRVGLGTTKNGRWDGSKLRADGWFEEERVQKLAPEIHNKLNKSEPFELSTGLFTENLPPAGTHLGKPYDLVARNYRSDHVAVLVNETGACSVNDGCGVVVNEGLTLVEDEVVHNFDPSTGLCLNCGGVGGNPGPCPMGGGGIHGEASSAKTASETAVRASKKAFEKPITIKASGGRYKLVQANDRHTIVARAEKAGKTLDYISAHQEHTAIAKRHEEIANRAVHSTPTGEVAQKAHIAAAKAHHEAAKAHKGTRNTLGRGNHGLDRMISHAEELTTVAEKTGTSEAYQAAADAHNAVGMESAYPTATGGKTDYSISGRHRVRSTELSGKAKALISNKETSVANETCTYNTETGLCENCGGKGGTMGPCPGGGGAGASSAIAARRAAATDHNQYAKDMASKLGGARGEAMLTSLAALKHSLMASSRGSSHADLASSAAQHGDHATAAKAHHAAAKAHDRGAAKHAAGKGKLLDAHDFVTGKGATRKHPEAAALHREAAKYQREAAKVQESLVSTPEGKGTRNEETVENKEKCPKCDASMKDGECTKCDYVAKKKPPIAPSTENAVNERDKMLAKLTANCTCDKDKAALNGLSDETLKVLVNTQPVEPAKKPDVAITVNSNPTPAPDKPMAERMTPEELQVWNYGRQSMENHKQQLVSRLTANIADPTRKTAMTTNLLAKGIPELNDLLSLMPPPAPVQNTTFNPNGTDLPPIYLGAAGGDYTSPTINRAHDSVDLPVTEQWPPVLNYEEHANLPKSGNKAVVA